MNSMNKNKTKYKKFFMCVCFGLLNWTLAQADVSARQFAAPMGEERWEVSTSRLRCGLSLKVKNYGVAAFEQHATKAPHFAMTHWQREQEITNAGVWLVPPVWNESRKSTLVTRNALQEDGSALTVSGTDALKMLAGLADGYRSRIGYQSTVGYQVHVYLSPINFQKAYASYMNCIASLLPFNFDDIKDTVVRFSNDYYGLTEQDKALLDKVQLYASVDKEVSRIEIAGHSDNIGRRGVNNAISELRAKHVYDYLIRRGVSKKLLHVTWYGMENPIASNRTAEGRAKNRRVEVNLYK